MAGMKQESKIRKEQKSNFDDPSNVKPHYYYNILRMGIRIPPKIPRTAPLGLSGDGVIVSILLLQRGKKSLGKGRRYISRRLVSQIEFQYQNPDQVDLMPLKRIPIFQ